MAKRFGRNQKRRMRAEIAELSDRAHKAEEAERAALARGQRDRQTVIDTARVLGDYFATLPPVSRPVIHLQELFHAHKIPSWRDIPGRAPCDNAAPLVMDTMDLIELHPMLVEQVRDHYGHHTLLRVRQGDRTIAAYALTDEAKQALPRDMLARKIGEELGNHIARQEVLS